MLFPPLETGCKTIPESGSSLKEEAKVDKRTVCTVNICCIAKLCTPPSGNPRVDVRSVQYSIAQDPENFVCLSRTFLKLPKWVKMQYRGGYTSYVRRWQGTAIVLDLPSRPTSVRFNNARSTSLYILYTCPTRILFHFFTYTRNTSFLKAST